MTYLVLSDIHHSQDYLQKLLKSYQNKIQGIFFAGDGLDVLRKNTEHLPVYAVKGNIDHGNSPQMLEVKIENKTILITHGHLFEVKQDLSRLKKKALELKSDLVIFGHTHIPFCEKSGEAILFNPGTLQRGEYGILNLEEGEFFLTHENL